MIDSSIGRIVQPDALNNIGTLEGGGLGILLNLVFNLMIIVAGIYALFNFILAGYAFMSAGDDPKQVQSAWSKIYQSVIGLLIAAGALVLAAVFGIIIFGDAGALLFPEIPVL